MMTSAQNTFGTVFAMGNEVEKDAIHIPVMLVTAGHTLTPGAPVVLGKDSIALHSDTCEDAIGVVDPFLQHNVRAHQMFWLFLNPNSISSVKHTWTHPAVDGISKEQDTEDYFDNNDYDDECKYCD